MIPIHPCIDDGINTAKGTQQHAERSPNSNCDQTVIVHMSSHCTLGATARTSTNLRALHVDMHSHSFHTLLAILPENPRTLLLEPQPLPALYTLTVLRDDHPRISETVEGSLCVYLSRDSPIPAANL